MVENNAGWSHYNIGMYTSLIQNIRFSILYETMDEAYHQKLIDLYCRFSMSHLIEKPIIILPIDTLLYQLGAPLMNDKPQTPGLYHIPLKAYPYLEEMLTEDAILLNGEMMKLIKPFDSQFLGNLLTSLEVLHENDGLMLLGVVNET